MRIITTTTRFGVCDGCSWLWLMVKWWRKAVAMERIVVRLTRTQQQQQKH